MSQKRFKKDIFVNEEINSDKYIKFNNASLEYEGLIKDTDFLYLKCDHKEYNKEKKSRYRISPVCFGRYDLENNKDNFPIGYMYEVYYYKYQPIFQIMLENKDRENIYRIYISKHKSDISIKMTKLIFNIYVKKSYFDEIINKGEISYFLYELCTADENKYHYKYKKHNILITDFDSKISDNIFRMKYKVKLKPYKYQLSNILWLSQHENTKYKISLQKNNDLSAYKINSIDKIILFDNKRNVYDEDFYSNDESRKYKFTVQGCVLCDEVGLGKTLSSFCTIMHDYNTKNMPTLIITPDRLCKQWYSELIKYSHIKLNIIKILTFTNIKYLTIDKIKDSDIVIVSEKVFKSLKYNESTNKIRLSNYNWYRIIIDEAHEVLNSYDIKSHTKICKMRGKLESYNVFNNEIYKLKSNRRILLTATPLANGMDGISQILKFISNDFHINYVKQMEKHANIIYDTCFRYNNKESIKNIVKIPDYKIDNVFLEQTKIERALYNIAKEENNKEKMIQMCTHVLISEENASILKGENYMSIDEIQKKMLKHYNKKLNKEKIGYDNVNNKKLNLEKKLRNIPSEYEKNKLDNCKISIKIRNIYKLITLKNKLPNEINNITNELKEREKTINSIKRCVNIFNNFEEYIEETESCGLCFEDIADVDISIIIECKHIFCTDCMNSIVLKHGKCPMCNIKLSEISIKHLVDKMTLNNDLKKYGTKMAYLVEYIKKIPKDEKVLIFSRWFKMLEMIENVLNDYEISNILLKGNIHKLSNLINRFKTKNDKVLLLSMDKASSGMNLTEANHVILLDTVNVSKNLSSAIEKQAIGRCVRLGQKKKVIVKKFIMKRTIEEDNFNGIN